MRKRMRLFLTSCLIATVFVSLQMFSRPATAQEPPIWKTWVSQSVGVIAQTEGIYCRDGVHLEPYEFWGYPEDLICTGSYAYQYVNVYGHPNEARYWIQIDWDGDGYWDDIYRAEVVYFTGYSWSRTYTHSPETVTIGGDGDNMLIHIYSGTGPENAALQAGTIDINDWPLTKTWVDAWAGNPAIQMKGYAAIDDFDFDLNNQRWPTGVTLPRELDPATGTYKHYMGTSEWDDEALAFRQAIAYLADKDMYVSDIVKGYGYRKDSVVPAPALGGYIPPDLPIYMYDPCAAAATLDAAGFVQGSTPNPYYDPGVPCSAEYIRTDPRASARDGGDLECLEMYVREEEEEGLRRAAGEMLCESLRIAGIPVCIHILPKSACIDKVMVQYDYHIYTGETTEFQLSARTDTGKWFLSDLDWLYWLYASEMYWGGTETSYLNGVGWSVNYLGYCSHAFDAAAGAILTATDVSEVRDACFEAQIAMANDCPVIPLWCSAGVKAYDSGFDGVVSMEGYGIDNYWSFLNMYKEGDNTIDWGFCNHLQGPNVITANLLWDWKLLGLMYDSLIGFNPFNFAEEYGWLAEDWSTGTWEPGKMYAQFTIVPGAVFHDGSPVTAEDVKFSLEFTRDCGPGVAWNYAGACDIDHVDTQAEDPSLGPRDVKVCFTYESYWMLHWAGGIPILNKDLWMAANDAYGWGYGTDDWDPMLVRDYHLWNDDVNENGIIDLCEDGTGAWVYDSTDSPGDIGASTWVLLTANRDFYKTQTEISDYIAAEFHAIGDVNDDGVINIVDLVIIARALGTDESMTHGTGWDEYNPAADLNEDGYVDLFDLFFAGKNYGRTIDC